MKVLNRLDNSLDLPEEERLLLDAVRALCRDRVESLEIRRASRNGPSDTFLGQQVTYTHLPVNHRV